jgi:prepilin-type N-terminal cleavage/methylation domain-containing protein
MAGAKLRCQRGFSLIEVLISLVILAVGLLGLALFQTTAIKGNAIASKWTVATELAQDRLERFRHVGWASIQPSVPGGFVPGTQPLQSAYGSLGGSVGDNTSVRGTQYFRVWQVSSNATNSLKTITVWCCWRDDAAQWHNIMLVTQRSNIGGI